MRISLEMSLPDSSTSFGGFVALVAAVVAGLVAAHAHTLWTRRRCRNLGLDCDEAAVRK